MIKAFVFDAYGTLYDVQSVSDATEAAFPGRGAYITQIWRMKQLEYSWLHALMGHYADFWTVTRESLAYSLATLGLPADERLFDVIAQTYNTLAPYPDAVEALVGLSRFKRVILSNGSADMLAQLVRHSGLGAELDGILSVAEKQTFKPDPRAYAVVEEKLGLTPDEVVFVSSNGFDVAGAKRFGFKVARIERVTPAALKEELAAGPIGPASFYKALRTQLETCGPAPDFTISSLKELVPLSAAL